MCQRSETASSEDRSLQKTERQTLGVRKYSQSSVIDYTVKNGQFRREVLIIIN
jgi:hypothetical protein